MGLRSFFGILPLRLPYPDAEVQTETLPVPEEATLLWTGRMPSDLSVKKGDRINAGQDISKQGKGPFVSTLTGLVKETGVFLGPDGRESVSITITQDGGEVFDAELKAVDDFSKLNPAELRAAAGRAGFSIFSSVSIDPMNWPAVETLVISALDKDPGSFVNQQILKDRAEEAEAAALLISRAAEAGQSILAIPEHLTDAARVVSRGSTRVVFVPPVYPNGLPEILARKVGAGILLQCRGEGIVGNILVVGIEQALAMADCLKDGRPLLEKTVTFSSGRDGRVKNYRVRIGTPVGQLLKKEGVELEAEGKLIMNGGLTGFACFSADQPFTAAVDAVHVQAPSEVFFFENRACTNCGKCNYACPVNLEVNLLGRYSEYGIFEKCRDLGAENCIECGLCAYVCPARRPLVQYLVHAKHVIETETFEDVSMEEVMACNACGPTCPAIRLFETTQQEQGAPKE